MWLQWIGRWLCCLTFTLLLLSAHSGQVYAIAGQTNQDKSVSEQDVNQLWNQVDRLAQQLYQYAVSGEFTKASQEMAEIEVLFNQRRMYDGLSIERVKTLSAVLVEVKWELNRIQIKPALLVEAASQLHLAIDAKVHMKKAMWMQYEQVLSQEMSDMLQAQTTEQWSNLSKKWIVHVERILPAVTLTRSIETVEMMKSLVTLIQKTESNEVSIAQAKEAFRNVEETWMHALFGRDGERAVWALAGDPNNSWKLVMWLACFISVTLAYVGYMKYRHLNEDIHPDSWIKSG